MSERSRKFFSAWNNEQGDDATWWVDHQGVTHRLTPTAISLLRRLEVETNPVVEIRLLVEIMNLVGLSESRVPVRYSERTGLPVEFEWQQNNDTWDMYTWRKQDTPLVLVGYKRLMNAMGRRKFRVNTVHGEVLCYWTDSEDNDGYVFHLEYLPDVFDEA